MRALTLGSCLAVAVTLAFTANQIIDASLRAPAHATLRPPRLEDRGGAALDEGRLSRALGTPMRPKSLAAPTRPMPLKLLGTLDDHAAAMIETTSGQCRTLRIGDRWNDIELVGVGHGRVTVRRDGAIEEVGIGVTLTPPPASSRIPIAITPRGAALSMQRSELERQLPELVARALQGGQIIPAFQGSTMIGFRLLAVRPGSLYEELGLKTGDVFETVNGASLADPSIALSLLPRLREQKQVALTVNRGGQRLSWELSLN